MLFIPVFNLCIVLSMVGRGRVVLKELVANCNINTMNREKNKALALLLLSCLPLLLEMHGTMNTVVDWRIILFLLLYTLFAFKATDTFESDRDQFTVFSQCCKVSLIMVVCYSWMSLFSSFESTMVPCLLVQAEGPPSENLVECRRHGLVTKCLKSVTLLFRANKLSNQCPASVLGTSLGSIYLLSVIFFRFIPTAFYGLWNLYVWDVNIRFRPVSPGESGGPTSKRIHEYRTPSSNVLLVCAAVVLCCITVNIAIPHVAPLSHISTTLPFFCIVVMHYNLETRRYRENVKHTISILMTTCLYMSIAFSILDFVMNSLSMINTCIQADAQEDAIIEKCSDPQGPMSIQECYQTISEVDSIFFATEKCPVFGSPSVTLRYVGDVMLVVALTIGVMVAFARGVKHRILELEIKDKN